VTFTVLYNKFNIHVYYSKGPISLTMSTIQCGKPFFSNTRRVDKLLLAKMKKSSPCLASDIYFKLANKYQINNTVMFNNLFCRFWQVINLVYMYIKFVIKHCKCHFYPYWLINISINIKHTKTLISSHVIALTTWCIIYIIITLMYITDIVHHSIGEVHINFG
jgi:hypothetical protein